MTRSADEGMNGAMMFAGSRHRSVRQGSRLTNGVAGQVSKAAQKIWKPMGQKRSRWIREPRFHLNRKAIGSIR